MCQACVSPGQNGRSNGMSLWRFIRLHRETAGAWAHAIHSVAAEAANACVTDHGGHVTEGCEGHAYPP